MNEKDKDIIEKEIFTESLNEMYVRCIEFQEKHPDNKNYAEINTVKKEIAIAYRESRIYTDIEHRRYYNGLFRKAKKLIKEALP